ncbi:hypothetical protein FNU76_05635 [Chitinimonas arctica]|uniref:Uncharacterized protein n=1 Tax=Chitinimonas arctica TaxID=2594795 RepID=A0A516SCK1_9NEIS|nr:hypothetical protein [Chitinimonas arctica]QDQ25871.1 hypothetical protein FNU76_05635 [Chitinimonas arctica]
MFDFKGLIDALMRRAREDEEAGPTATRMLINLPRHETLIVLTEIIKALAALNRNPRIGLKDRYRAVQAFDEKARPLAALLVKVFRGEEHIDTILPQQIQPSLLACWKELASAYKLCLKQHAQSPSARFAGDAELITLRALAYYAEQAKWAYMRYYDAEPRIWRSLNRLYQIAEAAGFSSKPIAPYPDVAPLSVGRVYRHALLLKLAEPERRRVEELWMIDGWVDGWLEYAALEKIIRPRDQTFAINLDEPKPPMKLRRNMVGERYRYLDTEPLANYLGELAREAGRGGKHHDPAEGDSLTRLYTDLAVVYSREGQARSRRSERRHKEREAGAAVGMDHIGRLLRENSQTGWESWMLGDESANGLGAHYKAHFDDKMTVGEILALKDEHGICLAVVRRLHKTREGQIKVGAERLASKPAAVLLEGPAGKLPALYCAESPHGRMLLLQRHGYQVGQIVNLSAGGKSFSIQLGPTLEILPEYVLCGFTVLAKT